MKGLLFTILISLEICGTTGNVTGESESSNRIFDRGVYTQQLN